MTDVKLTFSNLKLDLDYELGNFTSEQGLETAISLSLFTDSRIAEEELPIGETERRGWWGDDIADTQGDQIGSKLWLLERMKATPLTRAKAEEYARSALKWLVDDGVAVSVVVKAMLVDRERIDLSIDIQRPNVKNKYYYRYQLAWEGQLMNVRKAN